MKHIFFAAFTFLLLCGCSRQEAAPMTADTAAFAWDTLAAENELTLQYARQFTVENCTGDYRKITIGETHQYLLVPKGAAIPEGIPENVTVLCQPFDSVYLAATSAMDLFRELDEVDTVTLSALDAPNWHIRAAQQAMENGTMAYAGKYNAPDYERILSAGCDLAVESTMILHAPEVQEQLERLGIPVLVERSSYESHPLGRMEWIKLYGILLGKEAEATAFFDDQLKRLAPILEQENTDKTVAFFYITSNGAANVRKPGDYIAKAIDLAGGRYVPDNTSAEENALSTMNLQMESFFEEIRDADILIYNSAIDNELQTIAQLLEKSPVLKNCRAVKEKQVWCTGKNLFQESLGIGDLIADLHTVLTESAPDEGTLTYLHRLT